MSNDNADAIKDTFFAIFSNSHGVLLWYGRAKNEDAAFAKLHAWLSSPGDVADGEFPKSDYHFTSGATAVKQVKDLYMGFRPTENGYFVRDSSDWPTR